MSALAFRAGEQKLDAAVINGGPIDVDPIDGLSTLVPWTPRKITHVSLNDEMGIRGISHSHILLKYSNT